MKKVLVIVMALAISLIFSVNAFAAGSENEVGTVSQQMSGNHGPKDKHGRGGQPPEKKSQAPGNNNSGDLTELPDMDGRAAAPSDASKRIDFDALTAEGVISQDTLAKIKAYMEENKPTTLPEKKGEAPEKKGEAPEKNEEHSMEGKGLLAELLSNSIITQTEYDAICGAISG